MIPVHLCGLVVLIVLGFLAGINNVNADIRDDIAKLKTEIVNFNSQIESLDIKIISQKNIIVGDEIKLKEAQEHEKQLRVKVGDSWASITEHEAALVRLDNAEKKLIESNNKLNELIDQRNNYFKLILENEKKLIELNEMPEPRKQTTGLIGISLDDTCLAYIKNNLTTTCPTYEQIMILFPDSSNQQITGGFGDYNGIFQRLPSETKNSFEYYRNYNGVVLFVDPPIEIRNRINNIEIKSSLDEYLLRGVVKSYNKTDHSITLGAGRYVDNCKNVYVNSNEWIEWVGDSMNYLLNDCSAEFTKYNNTKRTQLLKIEHDITTSYKYKLESWIKEIKENCLTEFMKCKDGGVNYKIVISDSSGVSDVIKTDNKKTLNDNVLSEDRI